jgi:peptidoglycan biosynthesis protein MviN/MurJ (putative lipid II flippase)
LDDHDQQQQIARSATIVSIGNVLSRLMGLAREATIANIYGASGTVSAFKAASQVPLQLYELLIGGMVSSALVPTLSEHAARQGRRGQRPGDELWRLASLLFTLAALTLGLVVLLLETAAPLVSLALVKFDAPLQAETTHLLRIMFLSVLFLGLSGMATALCQALRRFALPAFTAVVLNASIVAFALVLGPRWVTEIDHPTLDDIWVDDQVSGEIVEQDDGTLFAKSIVVAPPDGQARALGRVTAIDGQTLTIEGQPLTIEGPRPERGLGHSDGTSDVEGQEGVFTVLTDEHTVFQVRRRQVRALAIGLVVGAALQVLLQLPALRDMRFRPAVDLGDPTLQRILRLYVPVVLSLVVASLGVLIDRNLASRTGPSSISWMAYATTLIQFPLGLVSMAIATAILPTLSRLADQDAGRQDGNHRFRATLAGGLRLVLVLSIPATVGLLVLARPLVSLLFQHGEFDAYDTTQTSAALRYYLIGLLPAAIDQPLVFAFYARKDTWRPALVGILGVLFYLVIALPTVRTLGMVGLILANGAQLAGHAAVMVWLFGRRVGTLRGYDIGRTLARSLVAAAVMGGIVYGIGWGIDRLALAAERTRWALTVLVGGTIGLGVYLALCALLKVREVEIVRTLVGQAIRRTRQPNGSPRLPHSDSPG